MGRYCRLLGNTFSSVLTFTDVVPASVLRAEGDTGHRELDRGSCQCWACGKEAEYASITGTQGRQGGAGRGGRHKESRSVCFREDPLTPGSRQASCKQDWKCTE